MNTVGTLLLLAVILLFSGCSAIELVFKAGMWWAFFLAFVLVFGAGWLYFKAKRKK